MDARGDAEARSGAILHLRAQLKLYLRPDWATARDDLTESLRRDPNDALANVFMGFLCGLLGERAERSRWTAKAVALILFRLSFAASPG